MSRITHNTTIVFIAKTIFLVQYQKVIHMHMEFFPIVTSQLSTVKNWNINETPPHTKKLRYKAPHVIVVSRHRQVTSRNPHYT
jgi:hypothetical protein